MPFGARLAYRAPAGGQTTACSYDGRMLTRERQLQPLVRDEPTKLHLESPRATILDAVADLSVPAPFGRYKNATIGEIHDLERFHD